MKEGRFIPKDIKFNCYVCGQKLGSFWAIPRTSRIQFASEICSKCGTRYKVPRRGAPEITSLENPSDLSLRDRKDLLAAVRIFLEQYGKESQ